MTYNLLCISVVNPVTYDAPSSVWHAGFDLWLMIRHIQLPRKKGTESLPCLVDTIEMIWCQMRQKKIYIDALKKMPYVENLRPVVCC